MIIDITNFLIVSTDNFNEFIARIGSNLTIADKEYMLTYLFANLLAYIIILIFITSLIKAYRFLFSKRERSWL